MSLFNRFIKKIKLQLKNEDNSLFVNKLKLYVPNIVDLLNPAAKDSIISELESITGNRMPEYFKKLYLQNNGEGEQVFGVMAGFRWMSIESIIREWRGLQVLEYDITSGRPGFIKEGGYKRGWIPFAEDCGGSFLVMDLDPGVMGTNGQIITMDRNSDISYVVSESLEEFVNLIDISFRNGKLSAWEDEDTLVIGWKKGHLFDDMLMLSGATVEKDLIPVSGFWKEYFKSELVNDCISTETLAKQQMVFINADTAKKFGVVSLEILKNMSNLKELIIHAEEVNGFEHIKDIPSLSKLVIGTESFKESDLRYLVNLEQLKQLTLVKLSLNNIHILGEIENLKCLRLYKITSLNSNSIGSLKSLTELSIEDMKVEGLSFLSSLVELTKLELKKVTIPNLEFLKDLNNLTIFQTDCKAEDESGLRVLGEMQKLKKFVYPIRDLRIIKNCTTLNTIGVDASKLSGLEDITDLNITDITIFNATSDENARSIVTTFKKYFKLQSYGWQKTWED